jgi:molybdopterin molybdotransferase
MSKFTEIEQQISKILPAFEVEAISLKDAFGRVIQEDVLADSDMPPFHKSAMDGFACRLEDIQNELEVLETINAGKVPSFEIEPNTCSKIMTGAMIPAGADCVFKIEESVVTGVNRVRCINQKTKLNICYQGEDYKTGEVLLRKGTIVNVSQMAVLAGAGYAKLKVSALPKIAVIATGSELVEPQDSPTPGKIRNSNASQILTQLRKINILADYHGIAGDDFSELTKIFSDTLEKYDYVIFTGGASNGDFDLIPKILKAHNFSILWNTTGIKPGNPMTFAQKENKFCFGLSGNPVSSMVQFEIIVKPVVYKLLGASFQPLRIKTELALEYNRKQADRLELVPVAINSEGQAELIPFNGSAHINALTLANALMEVPEGKNIFLKGEMVYVRPL